MSTFLVEVRDTLVPGRAGPYGPLPPLLVAMTLVTGLVDAFSYLALGHVFVANMTGNVVFLGFAVAGAHGFSVSASLVALAVLRRRIGHRRPDHRALRPSPRASPRPFDGRRVRLSGRGGGGSHSGAPTRRSMDFAMG